MVGWSCPRWDGFVTWLGSEWPQQTPAPQWSPQEEVGGVPPLLPVLALARRVAVSLKDWLASCLEAGLDRQWSGQPLGVLAACAVGPAEVAPRLWRAGELRLEAPRLAALLEAEVERVAWLAGARQWPYRQGAMELEVYSWAQIFALARVGQVYWALERAQGSEAAAQTLLDLAEPLAERLLKPAAAA